MCEVRGVSAMAKIYYKKSRSEVMGTQLEELVAHYNMY
jgi:hypothetical protein